MLGRAGFLLHFAHLRGSKAAHDTRAASFLPTNTVNTLLPDKYMEHMRYLIK